MTGSPPIEDDADDGWSFGRIAIVSGVIISVVVAVLISTGVIGGPTHEPTESLSVDRDVEGGQGAISIEGELAEGRYQAVTVSSDKHPRYDISGSASDEIDVFFVASAQYDSYTAASEDFHYYEDVSSLDTDSIATADSFGYGKYMLVVDNTGAYGASPSGDVEVDLVLRVDEDSGE